MTVAVLPPQPGDIWRDLDPRGGPTFRVEKVDPPSTLIRRVAVRALNGKRPRLLLLERFRAHDGYRSGYGLVERSGQK